MGLIGLLVLAAAFRVLWLGYSEFQGDEAIVMLKAAAAVQGRRDVLFLHKKGPAEILIPTALLALAGRLPEAWARLPFALTGLGGLAVLYLLGREMASERTGLWATPLMALNGYLVAFSRIVQYQSLVFFSVRWPCGVAIAFGRGKGGQAAAWSWQGSSQVWDSWPTTMPPSCSSPCCIWSVIAAVGPGTSEGLSPIASWSPWLC